MAPEQLRGEPPDARTDVFSLGVIAYEMLTGELPFGRGSLADVVLAQARGVPPMPRRTRCRRRWRARSARRSTPDPDRRPPSRAGVRVTCIGARRPRGRSRGRGALERRA